MSKTQTAPGELELVRDFVNTLDVEDDRDELASPEALLEWLRARGLLDDGGSAGPSALRRATELREALRSLLLAHSGEEVDVEAPAAVLDAAARRAGLRLTFGEDGSSGVRPSAAGVDGALGRLLAIAHSAQADGTWERLKACRWDACHWAFYDHTKNHSGRWCTMDVCGNRAKAQTYRRRRAATSPPDAR
jgi:predicted RNA-binding Zn ribbon-like protein